MGKEEARETRRPQWVRSGFGSLRFFNNLLLIPMFTIMILETSTGTRLSKMDFGLPNLAFCVLFLLEWATGLLLARDRSAYLRNFGNSVDLVSSLPFGYFFQGLRAVRLLRVVRLFRIAMRAQRFRGKGARLVRVVGVVGATAFAGALAIRIVEPTATGGLFDALWWSVVTLSTVGYGDFVPTTLGGRLVGVVLITAGIGVFGYMAGFMTSLLEHPEDDEILSTLRRLEAKLDRLESTALARDRDGDQNPR